MAVIFAPAMAAERNRRRHRLALEALAAAGRAAAGAGGGGAGCSSARNGTLTPMALDPGRPWGWATKAYMENPNRKLYNKAKAKLLSGEQVFSFTQSTFNPEQYCQYAPHYDFTWFEMQHSTLRFDQVQSMMAACPVHRRDADDSHARRARSQHAEGLRPRRARHDRADRGRCVRGERCVALRALSAAGPAQPGRQQRVEHVPESRARPIATRSTTTCSTVVMIETPEGVDNAYEIASTPGIDVVILGNSDLTSFSGFAQTSDRVSGPADESARRNVQGGEVLGQRRVQFATGNRLSPDSRFHQNGRSHDGWVPPARGTMVQPPAQ